MSGPAIRRGALLWSPRELAAIGAKHMAYALLSDSQGRELASLPRSPGRLFSFGAFECRLDEDPRVDFMACALASDGGRSVGAGIDRGQARLVEAWVRSGSPAAEDTEGLWIEWDHPAADSWRPFLFVRADDARGPALWTRDRFARWLDWMWAESDDEPLDPIVRARVLELHARLPAGALILHLASLAPRGVHAVRVHASLPHERIGDFARELGFAVSPAFDSVLLALDPSPDPIGIQFDVGRTEPAFVDLEIYFDSSPLEDVRWKRGVDWISSRQTTALPKLEAALRWPANVAIGQKGALLVRRVSFKVRVHRDGSTACKAYLGFSPRWFSGAEWNESAKPEPRIDDPALL